jgi:hypothetical protein
MFSYHQEGLGGVMLRVITRRALLDQGPLGDHSKHYITKALLMITLNITSTRPSS